MLDSNYHNSSFGSFIKKQAKESPHSKVTLEMMEDDGFIYLYAYNQFGDYLEANFFYMDKFEVEEDADMAIEEYQLDIEITK